MPPSSSAPVSRPVPEWTAGFGGMGGRHGGDGVWAAWNRGTGFGKPDCKNGIFLIVMYGKMYGQRRRTPHFVRQTAPPGATIRFTAHNDKKYLHFFEQVFRNPSRGSKQPKHHPRRAVLPSHQNQPSIPVPAGRQAQTKTAANARSVAVYNDNDMAERSGFVSFVKEIGEKGRCL